MRFFFLMSFGFLLIMACEDNAEFILVSPGSQKMIYISEDEPSYVKLAVDDLINDVEKITGKQLKTTSNIHDCKEGCVIIGSTNLNESAQTLSTYTQNISKLKGKCESYEVESVGPHLIIAGSDERGTMFGIYHFIETYLEVDPLYFWKDKGLAVKEELGWKNVRITQNEPSFRYRGWFINDEDLLTEWKNGGGYRNIDYRFYDQVVHPDIMERVVEALVRLRYNMIIPASFIDIKNPAEKRLVDIAASRGVFLSMHHIEPLGVSGYTFFNYWKNRGKNYKFSYYSHPEELEEVWKVYAKEWAKYDNVVWQIGLRGIADRPMWMSDENIPQSDLERGKLISEAMATQMDIIYSVDTREEIPVTTTLWMEGSDLNRDGHLTFPKGVMVIFSDNSPGWEMQDDFFEMEKDPDRGYGIYYHHQLWGTGPHLVQGVPPSKAYEIMKLAVDHDSDEYAILNASNIRTFVLGLHASGEMLQNFEDFTPDDFMDKWCKSNFPSTPDKVKAAYLNFFESYQMHDKTHAPVLLDGQIKRKGLGLLNGLQKQMESSTIFSKERDTSTLAWANQYLIDKRCGDLTFNELETKVRAQKNKLNKVGELISEIIPELDGWEKNFFEVNLVSQQTILLGLTEWLDAIVGAVKTYELTGEKDQCREWMVKAVNAFEIIVEGQSLNTRNEKWDNWYRGEKKMNLVSCKEITQNFLKSLEQ